MDYRLDGGGVRKGQNIDYVIFEWSLEQNSASTVDLVPAMTALSNCTHYKCENRFWCATNPG